MTATEATCSKALKEYEKKAYIDFKNAPPSKDKGFKRKNEDKTQGNLKKPDEKVKNATGKGAEEIFAPPEAKKGKFQEQPIEKLHETDIIDLTKDNLRIFLSNLDYK